MHPSVNIDAHSCPDLFQGLLGHSALDLHPILPFMPVHRIQEVIVEPLIVGEQQQSLTVIVKAANGVDIQGHIKIILQRLLSILR